MIINSHYFAFTVDVDGEQIEHDGEARYEYHKAERGSRERGSGIQLEPDYPAGVEILKIVYKKQDIMELFNDKQLDAIAAQIMEE